MAQSILIQSSLKFSAKIMHIGEVKDVCILIARKSRIIIAIFANIMCKS